MDLLKNEPFPNIEASLVLFHRSHCTPCMGRFLVGSPTAEAAPSGGKKQMVLKVKQFLKNKQHLLVCL